MVELPKIFTIDEVAQLLKVNSQVILDEIYTGHLEGFKVGNEWRTTDTSIADFILRGGSQDAAKMINEVKPSSTTNIALQQIETFSYKWPDGTTEKYTEAYEGTAKVDDAQVQVKIGVGERPAAGKIRKRVVVFLNGRPTVEFAGVDDFEKSCLVASVITLHNRKRLKPGQRVPNEYRNFPLVKYNTVVKGPHAMSVIAVLTKIDDYNTMISHALLRAMFRDKQ